MSSKNLHRYMKEYLKYQPKTLSYSQIEELIEYDAWLESQSRKTLFDMEGAWVTLNKDGEITCKICGRGMRAKRPTTKG